MRRTLTLIAKNIPYLTKRLAFFTALYVQQNQLLVRRKISCMVSNDLLRQNLQNIEQKAIKIVSKGQFIGYAYCFAKGYLVTTTNEIQNNKQNRVQYFLGEQKLRGSFKIIGTFQNLVFIQYTLNEEIKPINGDFSKPTSYSAVQIVKKKEYFNIRNGYFIAQDSGYAIVSGEAEIGSLIIANNTVSGITVQLGQQSDKGFARVIQWRHLVPILNYVKGKKIHLGISVQGIANQEGVQIVRVAPNSPLKNDIMMGDIILRANGNKFRTSESLYRIFVESNGQVELQIEREGKKIETKIHL